MFLHKHIYVKSLLYIIFILCVIKIKGKSIDFESILDPSNGESIDQDEGDNINEEEAKDNKKTYIIVGSILLLVAGSLIAYWMYPETINKVVSDLGTTILGILPFVDTQSTTESPVITQPESSAAGHEAEQTQKLKLSAEEIKRQRVEQYYIFLYEKGFEMQKQAVKVGYIREKRLDEDLLEENISSIYNKNKIVYPKNMPVQGSFNLQDFFDSEKLLCLNSFHRASLRMSEWGQVDVYYFFKSMIDHCPSAVGHIFEPEDIINLMMTHIEYQLDPKIALWDGLELTIQLHEEEKAAKKQ